MYSLLLYRSGVYMIYNWKEGKDMKKRSFQPFRFEEITDIHLEDAAREAAPLEMPPSKSTIIDMGSILLILARVLEFILIL